ncbi:MAG: AAA family ATPase [Nitrospirota bacterium]|nr:AAA family ATPase [Nitrospirota bacterium]
MLPSIIEDLLHPRAYPGNAEGITLSQTHLSYLLFTREHVYKIKKPVDFGFLDFTTLEKRLFYCQREIELNRRLCPDIYLDVVKITREGEHFQMEGTGHPTEYAVKMKRLPGDRMLSELLRHDKVTEGMVADIAEKIADFHSRARTSPEISAFGDIAVIRTNTEENFEQIAPWIDRTIDRALHDQLAEYTRNTLQKDSLAFISRVTHDHIRDCHGDIHAENICVTNGIYIYDCIEFNDRFRYSDTIADIAFLIMDLEYNGYLRFARIVRDVYQQASKDDGLERLLDFYKVYRAVVRGKVSSFKLGEEEVPEEEKLAVAVTARNYFGLAGYYVQGHRPFCLVVNGLTGTGKSTVARGLASRTGATILSSDIIRKELAGIAPETRQTEDYGGGIYSSEMTAKTYAAMFERAEAALRQGDSVILDATFISQELRQEAYDRGVRLGIEPVFIECQCPEETVVRRLRERLRKKKSVSDGRLEIYQRQKQRLAEQYPDGAKVIAVDTSQPFPDAISSVFRRFWSARATGVLTGRNLV